MLQLGCMDIDYAFRKDEPPAISATNTKVVLELYENWEMSNRLFIMFIKTHISVGICDASYPGGPFFFFFLTTVPSLS